MVMQCINEMLDLMSNWSVSVCRSCIERLVWVDKTTTDLVPSSSRK